MSPTIPAPGSRGLTCFAHRGGGGHGPENRLSTLDHALALGVDALEIDVWLAGGELVVSHDRRLGRDHPGQGRLSDYRLEQLHAFSAAAGSEPVATLAQVLARVAGRALLNIELKGPDTVGPAVQAIIAACEADGLDLDRFLLSSFDQRQLQQAQRLLPALPRGLLLYGVPLDWQRSAETLAVSSVHASIDFLPAELIAQSHDLGLPLYVYTVNEADDLAAMAALGVDGVFTDVPEQVMAFNRQRVA